MGMNLEEIQRLYPVKVIDSISDDMKVELVDSGKCVSYFFLFLQENEELDFLRSYAHGLEIEYYLSRATNKTLSPIYQRYADIFLKNYLEYITEEDVEDIIYHAYGRTDGTIVKYILVPRFAKKWTDVYNLLYSQEYSPLDSYSETEKRSADDTDTKTYDITDGKTGENTDVLTLNTQTDENGKVGTSETTTRSVESDNNVYGFNSSSPVGDTTSTDTVSESVVGEADNNTRESTRLRTGTESKAIGINETLKKTGTETTKYGKDETVTRSGRREAGSDLLNKELSFRSKQILMDIILDDIISVTTSPLYL